MDPFPLAGLPDQAPVGWEALKVLSFSEERGRREVGREEGGAWAQAVK